MVEKTMNCIHEEEAEWGKREVSESFHTTNSSIICTLLLEILRGKFLVFHLSMYLPLAHTPKNSLWCTGPISSRQTTIVELFDLCFPIIFSSLIYLHPFADKFIYIFKFTTKVYFFLIASVKNCARISTRTRTKDYQTRRYSPPPSDFYHLQQKNCFFLSFLSIGRFQSTKIIGRWVVLSKLFFYL